VTSKALLKLSEPSAEGVIRSDLAAATVAMLDRALLDPAATATDVSPASITAGVVPVPASGTTLADLRNNLSHVQRNL
jgi:hypothetical protein